MSKITEQVMQFVSVMRACVARRTHLDETGAAMVEYALLVALIAAACITVLTALSGGIQNLFTNVTNSL